MIRTSLFALGLTLAVAGGAWTTQAAQRNTERHPVLRNSIRQIEGVKDRLQKAPSDFGGHRAAAIEALNRATSELEQAIQFDSK